MWFMRVAASAHFSRNVRHILNNTYEYHNPRMGRGERTLYPPRSADLDSITVYLWVLWKAIVYLAPVHNVTDTSPAHCEFLSDCPQLFRDLWTGSTVQDKTCPSMYWISRRTFWALLVSAFFQCCNSEIKHLKAHVYTTPVLFFWYVAFNPKVCPHISDSSYIAFILVNMSLCVIITS
jgi:hypothetical protein